MWCMWHELSSGQISDSPANGETVMVASSSIGMLLLNAPSTHLYKQKSDKIWNYRGGSFKCFNVNYFALTELNDYGSEKQNSNTALDNKPLGRLFSNSSHPFGVSEANSTICGLRSWNIHFLRVNKIWNLRFMTMDWTKILWMYATEQVNKTCFANNHVNQNWLLVS